MKRINNKHIEPFSLLIKPVGSRCNLNCTYCFYQGTDTLLGGNRPPVMSRNVLDRLIGDYLGLGFPTSIFTWQGGEPTLAGLNFYHNVVEGQMAFGHDGQVVANALQTNGICIDDQWSEFLAEYRFLVGLSLDGPPEIHDHYRTTGTCTTSFEKVITAADSMRRYGVEFNILCMITDRSEQYGRDIYRFLVGEGFEHLQFIPCVEYNPESGALSPCNVSPEGYGRFLSDVFDEWYERDTHRVSVRTFESLIARLAGEEHLCICTMRENCHHYLVVEKEGDVYPCDFFVSKPYYVGNICETTIADLFCSKRIHSFSRLKSNYPAQCHECSYLDLCFGGCPKDRLCAGGGEFGSESSLCEGLKLFYSHTHDRMVQLAETVRKNFADIEREKSARYNSIGRNDPCPCGSGKKYKKCCME